MADGRGSTRHVEHTEQIFKRKRQLGFKARLKQPAWTDRIADVLSLQFGSFWFLAVNVVVFLGWILANVGIVPGLEPFDPFPFSLLTMAVSLEAIVLSVLVLISQNFQSRIAEMRAELDFEINVRAEQETTQLLRMVRRIQEHLGIECSDPELRDLERNTDLDEIQNAMELQANK